MKVLHLTADDKFVDMAIASFSRVAPKLEQVLAVYTAGNGIEHIKYIKTPINKIISRYERFIGLNKRELDDVDAIIVHSLNPSFYNIVAKIPKKIKVIWIGWGYDYYSLLTDFEEYESHTYDYMAKYMGKKKYLNITSFIDRNVVSVIQRIDYFAPVLSTEYKIVNAEFINNKFPDFIDWNYGNLEDDLIKNVIEECNGVDILIGNSSSPSNNHLDVFDMLVLPPNYNGKIVSPLSYGNSIWAQKVKERGLALFSNNFEPLTGFLPVEEYLIKLKSCGIAIMYHRRQQAVGNIISLLYLGVKVYLNPDSPVYEYLKEHGVEVFLFTDSTPYEEGFLQSLNANQRRNNRTKMLEIWSRAVNDGKSLALLEKIQYEH